MLVYCDTDDSNTCKVITPQPTNDPTSTPTDGPTNRWTERRGSLLSPPQTSLSGDNKLAPTSNLLLKAPLLDNYGGKEF